MYKCVETGELFSNIATISRHHNVYYNKVKRAIKNGDLLCGYMYIEVTCEDECSCKKVKKEYGVKD